jgi:hypothetical protein
MAEFDSAPPDRAPSQHDIEATLRDLLIRFRDSADQGPEQIEQFARAGAEAIRVQMQHRAWLSSAESAAVLGVSEATVRERVRQQEIPAVQGADQQPRIHRRDLSLYQLSQRLGATEEQVTPLTPPVAWGDDLGFDPWSQLMPG